MGKKTGGGTGAAFCIGNSMAGGDVTIGGGRGGGDITPCLNAYLLLNLFCPNHLFFVLNVLYEFVFFGNFSTLHLPQ